MEVILKQDVLNLGQKDDIIKVKDGYANNFLIPQGYASFASVSAKKVHAENLRQRAHKEEKIKNDALVVAKTIEGISLKISTKTSTTGKIYGSINTLQIAEALEEKGITIDRKQIMLPVDQIKEIGTYTATIKLHREVKIEIQIEVITE
ncbi:50S ribosomal protein L9 [Williamwhitmania taraxaci]|uniref:Large ribosomal subunit protein bL9 n=1 Tax=Williamwhitmania taraxaci TaxID=1640674 RepID=A0A1G6GMZ7_9BACT|nr:50S ribosomal protein L9 [Williamwhitmania taraxaci]SDB83367.1 large subunit ribosomal protein L9 [Williamwhitmania taraxaci]